MPKTVELYSRLLPQNSFATDLSRVVKILFALATSSKITVLFLFYFTLIADGTVALVVISLSLVRMLKSTRRP